MNKIKPTIKFCSLQKWDHEMSQGIAILREVLSKQGYIIKEFVFYKHFESILRKILLTNGFSSRLLNQIDYRYVNLKNPDYFFIKNIDRIIDAMSIKDSDILGFSVFSSYQLLPYLVLAKRIKQRFNVPIVFGGAYIKLFHGLVDLKKYDFIDFLVCSDGEIAFPKLIEFLEGKKKDISEVPSIKYAKNDEIIMNRPATMKIDDIPAPKYEDKYIKKILKQKNKSGSFGILYEISKGCPFKCAFCSYYQLNKISHKKVSKVIDELKYLKKKWNCNLFRFTDSNINANPKYLERLCKAMIEEKLEIRWVTFATPTLELSLLKLMKRAGCQRLIFGLESGSQRINSLMNKPFKIVVAEKCIKDSSSVGIKNRIEIIIGFPTERKEDILQTAAFLTRNERYIDFVASQKFQLISNTYIFHHPEEFNIKIRGNISDINPDVFKFDEIDGYSWKQKKRQVEKDFNLIIKQLKKRKINCSYDPRIDKVLERPSEAGKSPFLNPKSLKALDK